MELDPSGLDPPLDSFFAHTPDISALSLPSLCDFPLCFPPIENVVKVAHLQVRDFSLQLTSSYPFPPFHDCATYEQSLKFSWI